MKIRHLLLMLFIACAWASCSDDGDLAANDPIETTEGEAFISLNVALPATTTPGTRTGDNTANDNFDDGIAAEFAINDLTVILFNGNTPSARVTKVYTTKDFTVNNITNNGNITSSVTLDINVNNASDCYALVIANKNNVNLITNETFGLLNTIMADTITNFTKNGFFMSNSPILVTDGSGNKTVTTLVQCFPKSTIAAAKENSSDIYLERIMGKVEVKTTATTAWSGWTYTVPSTSTQYANDKIAFTNWGLDITNTVTYPVRNIDNSWLVDGNFQVGATGTTNRFYGVATDPMRIYYAVDPNYDGTGGYYNFNTFYVSKQTLKTLQTYTESNPNYDYCLENTFNVANQKQGQTTRVLVQANYLVKGASSASDFYMDEEGIPYSYSQFTEIIQNALRSIIPGATVNSFTFFTKAGSQNKSLKRAKLGSITYTSGTTQTTAYLINGSDNTTVHGVNEIIGRFDYYKDGICYYLSRVKHFGDKLTPWDNQTDYTITPDVTYTRDYLARYGIVRNNWYQLSFNSADNGPGSPIIPGIPGVDPESPDEPKPGDSVDPGEPGVDPNDPGTDPVVPADPDSPNNPTPDAPDDEVKYYIDCTINILSWAKREQQVDL